MELGLGAIEREEDPRARGLLSDPTDMVFAAIRDSGVVGMTEVPGLVDKTGRIAMALLIVSVLTNGSGPAAEAQVEFVGERGAVGVTLLQQGVFWSYRRRDPCHPTGWTKCPYAVCQEPRRH